MTNLPLEDGHEAEPAAGDVASTNGANTLNPAGWAPPRGYSNGVSVHGRLVVLAGQIGWDPIHCAFASDDFADQTRQTLTNIVKLLNEAGASPAHLVRLTWYITSRDDYVASRARIGLAWKEIIGKHYPPMSVVVVSGLLEERARVEIEATAVIPDQVG
ncbi:MAG: RidA family protein [Gemmatimonadaceae bacterium]